MKRFLPLALCLGLVAGCSSPQPKLVQQVDPYTQEAGFAFGPIIAKPCPGATYDGVIVDVSVIKQGDLQTLSIGIEAQS